MQVVPTTGIALLVFLLLAALGPYRGLWAFMIVTPMGAAAAFNLPAAGGASIVLADAAALSIASILFLRGWRTRTLFALMRPNQPGYYLALTFFLCVISVIFFPRIFAGSLEVFSIARVDGQVGIVSKPLRPTNGNITQLFRFFLAVLTFFAMATLAREGNSARPVVIALIVATLMHALLGALDVFSHAIGRTDLMEILRSANYSILVNHEIASLKRMIGGFPEASAFGYYTLGLFGFWFRYAALSHGKRYPSLFLLLSVFLLFRSASTSAYLAIGLFLILYVALNTQSTLGRAISARTARLIGFSALLMVLLACGAVAAYELIPDVKTFLDRLLFNKLETDSGVERLSWNARALENLQDTFGIGAGLGSLRASNWLIATLASIGVLGAIIFIAFLLSMFRTSGQRAVSEYYIVIEALKYGCLGLFLRAMVVKATPNLEIIFFAYAGLLVGLAAAKPSIPARSRESG